MKEARALDVSGDGMIDANEFARLLKPEVVLAAELKVKVDALWRSMPKNAEGSMERLACWDLIMADDELAALIGGKNFVLGKQ